MDTRHHAAAETTPAPDRTPELALLLACARWPQREADRLQIRELAAGRLDWPRFQLLAEHHRLVPLVAHTLHAAAPALQPGSPAADVAAHLQQLAAANTYRALRSLAELRRVVQELQAQDVPVRVLKGIPLAQSVFDDLKLRAVGDLDLLIDETAILQADAVMRSFGYTGLFHVERFTPKRLAFYRKHWKDLAYRNEDTGFEVDLHWRCFRNSAMPGTGLCGSDRSETVSFGSFHIKTLPRTETLLYLCVHGTLDGWLYLKSLADVGAQVRTLSAAELDTVAALATQYRILPELSATLTLVRRYFGMDAWSASLLPAADPTVRHILRFADHALIGGGFLSGRDGIRASTMMAFELGLRRDFSYRLELLLRVLFRARMWETIPLPDSLFAVYPLLSPFEWIVFRVRQWLGRPSPPAATLSI